MIVLLGIWKPSPICGARTHEHEKTSRRGALQVARVVAEDQAQPSGELRLAPTSFAPWTVSIFSKQNSNKAIFHYTSPRAGKRNLLMIGSHFPERSAGNMDRSMSPFP
jgi:hypothetical protein